MQFNITCKTIFEYILKKLVLCIQIRFVSTEKNTRIASRASCYVYRHMVSYLYGMKAKCFINCFTLANGMMKGSIMLVL